MDLNGLEPDSLIPLYEKNNMKDNKITSFQSICKFKLILNSDVPTMLFSEIYS